MFIDRRKSSQPTDNLSFQGQHAPVSASIHDTFHENLTTIINSNPAELIQELVGELLKRQKNIIRRRHE